MSVATDLKSPLLARGLSFGQATRKHVSNFFLPLNGGFLSELTSYTLLVTRECIHSLDRGSTLGERIDLFFFLALSGVRATSPRANKRRWGKKNL